MSTDLEHEYIFNWNRLKKVSKLSQKPFDLFDETLRDGIQSPSVTDPTIEQKIEILHLMESLGVAEADLGLPGAGKRAVEDVTALVEEIARSKLKIKAAAAGRTMVRDIQPIADIVAKEVADPAVLRSQCSKRVLECGAEASGAPFLPVVSEAPFLPVVGGVGTRRPKKYRALV